jgi:hypothetical protein
VNKSLKFLAIGLALAVLLVSQIGVDRSAVAHDATPHEVDLVRLDQDEVMFVDAHGQEKAYYMFGDMVHFLLRDNDLAQDTSRFTETVTWALNEPVTARDSFNLVTGAIADNDPRNEARVDANSPFDPVEGGVNIATTTAGTVTATIGDSGAGVASVTFRGTDFPPANNEDTTDVDESDVPFGDNAFAGGFQLRTVDQAATVDGVATTTDNYIVWERGTDLDVMTADAVPLDKPAALTPLVEKPVVKIGHQIVSTATTNVADGADIVTVTRRSVVTQDEVFVVVHSADGGTFALLDLVTTVTPGCTAPDTVTEGETVTVSVCTKIVQATFNYHIVDVFKDNADAGTGADDYENRALVTTSSSPSGKWVAIREVELDDLDDVDADSDADDMGENDGMVTTAPAPRSDVYYGSITLVDDAGTNTDGTGGRDKGNIYARDGDTITVQLLGKDHTTEVGSAEATADGLVPTITGIEPANSAVLNEAAPVVRFTVRDVGSGFDTGDFDSHVDLYLVPGIDFGDADEVATAKADRSGCKIYDSDLSATSLNEEEITVQFRSRRDWGADETVQCETGSNPSRFLAQTANIGDNSHGVAFGIRIVAQDVAGNEQRSLTKLTIDGQAPLLVAAGSYTGWVWNADKDMQEKARNGIRIKFNESLDKDTVDVDDFTVENPDVSVEEVIVGGVNNEEGQDKDEVVYLVLSEDLDSDAEPRVELAGSVFDLAGNERQKQIITRLTDRIGPTLTVDPLSAQLLAKDGEATVSFGSDENLSAAGSSDDIDNCTCLSISGEGQKTAGSVTTKGGTVNLPTPSTATYTFKQGNFKSTGLYGIMLQGTDSGANESASGATKVSNEEVTIKVADVKADKSVVVSLSKWPLADANFNGRLDDEVKVSTTSGGDPVATSTVKSVDWKNGTVTMDLGDAVTKTKNDDGEDVLNRTKVFVTYNYVKAEQTVQVDDREPAASFKPDTDTQNATPFIEIQWDEDKEYKGDTHKTVTITSATLTGPDDFEMVLVDDETDVLSTSDWVLYTYLPDSGLALGEYTITAIGRDEAGNVSEPQTGTFKVVARAPVTIPLNLGWNLVSLPGAAADSSIDAVINVEQVSQVLTYDPTVEGGWLAAVRVNGGWEGGLTDIDPSKAYLVYTTSVDDLKVDIPGFAQGTPDFPPTIQVYTGWNMIPAAGLDPKFETPLDTYLKSITWTRGYYYGTDGRIVQVTKGENEEKVTTGRGFLIYVEKDGVLVP